MVDPIIVMKRLTKVLMDGGNGLNIVYAEMLDAMGIDRAHIRPTGSPFHGIVPGKQAMPLGKIDLPITFRDPTNYRTETLTFEVVGLHETYHTILGCPCYAKFMAVRNNTYLKLKMLGLCRVITIGSPFQRAYECEVECYEHATAIVTSIELAAIREEVIEETPDPKRSTESFEPIEGPNLLGSKGILREVAEHALKIRPGSKPVKQLLCRFNEEKRRAIDEEIVKLLAVGFIKEV
ncbi:uncharacterized protein [Miscanthus floridulus]|uniref:uncharacterized protein n=1 Tax=Miscanthus floridulus TaxID=154761 RepID=UPI003458CFB6